MYVSSAAILSPAIWMSQVSGLGWDSSGFLLHGRACHRTRGDSGWIATDLETSAPSVVLLSYTRTWPHGRPARAAALLHSLPPKGCCLSSRSDGHVRPMRLAPASQRYLQPDLKREGPNASEAIASRHGGQNPSVAVPSRDGIFTRRGAPS